MPLPEDEWVIRIIKATDIFTSVITVPLYGILLLCFIKKNKSVDANKYFLMNQAFWSLFLHVSLAVNIPYFLIPIAGGYAMGLPQTLLQSVSATVFVLIGIGNLLCSALISFGYRYFLTACSKQRTLLSPKLFYTGCVVANLVVISFPVCAYAIKHKNFTQDYVNQVVFNEHPLYEAYLSESSVFVVSKGIMTVICYPYIILACIVLVVMSKIIHKSFTYAMELRKRLNQNAVTRNHRVLIIYNITQILLIFVFGYVPYFTLILCVTFQINAPYFYNLLHCFAYFIAMSQGGAILLLIRPYREYCMSFLPFKKSVRVFTIANIVIAPTKTEF